MEWYISFANSTRFAVIFPTFSRKSGLPTFPINKVSPVKRMVSFPSFATIVILSGECPGVFIASKLISPILMESPSSNDLCLYSAPSNLLT